MQATRTRYRWSQSARARVSAAQPPPSRTSIAACQHRTATAQQQRHARAFSQRRAARAGEPITLIVRTVLSCSIQDGSAGPSSRSHAAGAGVASARNATLTTPSIHSRSPVRPPKSCGRVNAPGTITGSGAAAADAAPDTVVALISRKASSRVSIIALFPVAAPPTTMTPRRHCSDVCNLWSAV